MVLYTYNPWLVVLSVLIAWMSAFTGLSMTRGLSAQGIGQRQLRIAVASVALGGGIWSMHFVAILAMRFEVLVYYDVLGTLASALIAILLAGLALLLMHFGVRSRQKMVLSGSILGLGIVVMHYVGLSAIEGCRPVYGLGGIVLAGGLAIGMGIAAIAVAYGKRNERHTLAATLIFGAAVTVVHFTAMSQTGFAADALETASGAGLASWQIALLLMLTLFVISGAFLLAGASFVAPRAVPAAVAEPAPSPAPPPPRDSRPDPAPRLPYERDGRTYLVPVEGVFALRAEGHYTRAYLESGPVFCPWSITEAEARLPEGFMRVHRSWLVNLSRVTAYERARDHGYCVFAGLAGLDRVPVARTRISALREALGL